MLNFLLMTLISERSRSLYAIARPSVCRLSSVTFVHPTQAKKIFGSVSTPFSTLTVTFR